MAASPEHRIGGWVFETSHLQWLRQFRLRKQLPFALFIWASYCTLFMAVSRKPYVRKGQWLFRLVASLLRKVGARSARVRLRDLFFYFDPSDTEFLSALGSLCSADSEVHQFVQKLPPGATFIDVGANYGVYSLAAAEKLGPTGKVIAFEANPRLAGLLRHSVTASNLSVNVFCAVLSETESEPVPFFIPEGGSGMGSLFEAHASFGHAEATEKVCVPQKKLDQFFLVPPSGDVWLKLDVEGSEFRVLKGAVELLKLKPKIWMEVHPASLAHSGSDLRELKSFLWAMGYRHCFELRGSKRYSLEALEDSELKNVLITESPI